nr:MAG TPA: Cell-membrane associated Mucin15 [Caudoviricetes sp.]
MTEFWMGVGMIAGAPVFGIVSALLAVGPIAWAFRRALKKVPEEERAEKKELLDSFVGSLAAGVFSLVVLVSVIKGFCFIF